VRQVLGLELPAGIALQKGIHKAEAQKARRFDLEVGPTSILRTRKRTCQPAGSPVEQ